MTTGKPIDPAVLRRYAVVLRSQAKMSEAKAMQSDALADILEADVDATADLERAIDKKLSEIN